MNSGTISYAKSLCITAINNLLLVTGCSCLLVYCSSDDPVDPACIDLSPATVTDWSTDIPIDAEVCILKEVLSESNQDKWVYTHDGTNYTNIEFIQNFETDPNLAWEVSLEYDAGLQNFYLKFLTPNE